MVHPVSKPAITRRHQDGVFFRIFPPKGLKIRCYPSIKQVALQLFRAIFMPETYRGGLKDRLGLLMDVSIAL
jgi:hypothetical protein